MILKSLILAILVFTFDLLIFGYVLLLGKAGKRPPKEVNRLKVRLMFVIPIVLFIQLFFSLVMIYTFQFLLAFKVFTKDIFGGISFAFLFFVPMLYLLLGNWLWGENNMNSRIAPSLVSWIMKFSIAGIYLGLFA